MTCKLPFAILLSTLSSSISCGSAEDTGAPDPTNINRADQALILDGMILHDTCGETSRGECHSCLERATSAQQQCRSSCNTTAAVTGNFAFNCADSCDRTPASEICAYACEKPDEPECVERAFEFEVTTSIDPDLQSACKAAVERDTVCDVATVGTDCKLYARVESSKVIPIYECLARRDCSSDGSECFDALPPASLVKELSDTCSTELESTLADLLSLEEPWVRPQLRDNALVCAARYCGTGDDSRCLEAWLEATVGSN